MAKKRGAIPKGRKFHQVMKEWKAGTLHRPDGKLITDQDEALAVAASEQRRANARKAARSRKRRRS